MTYVAATHSWPAMQSLVEKMILASFMKGHMRHQQYATENIRRRLDLKTDRPDFMTPFIKANTK